jgi:xanthine dehydrogenase YagR molybdenum-binding subunit
VLTHENRPHMADSNQAYKDEVAPLGAPFRPLYDDKIWFNGQPIAVVVADTSEVGWGMATGIWEALQAPITVRIVLTPNGHAEVACATSDIGTGTYTVMAQVAADMLGLPLSSITVKLGDSSLPQSPVEGGSWIATSVANGIATTADAIRDELLRHATQIPNSPLANADPDDVALADAKLVSRRDSSRAVSIADAMRYGAMDRIELERTTDPGHDVSRAHNTHAAIFAEVKIDEQLGVIRVARIVSAVAGGRIVNPKTASSQIVGGVVWGIGMALHEETLIDHAFGRIINANIAEYHVPVNADVQDIKVIFLDEPDASNRLGMKGLGEIGIVGVAAAIANAVYHATGKRVRKLPITLDKLLP